MAIFFEEDGMQHAYAQCRVNCHGQEIQIKSNKKGDTPLCGIAFMNSVMREASRKAQDFAASIYSG